MERQKDDDLIQANNSSQTDLKEMDYAHFEDEQRIYETMQMFASQPTPEVYHKDTLKTERLSVYSQPTYVLLEDRYTTFKEQAGGLKVEVIPTPPGAMEKSGSTGKK